MDFEYFEKRVRFIMKHPLLCAAIFMAGWGVAAVYFHGRIETLQTRLEFSASGEAMKMKADMEGRMQKVMTFLNNNPQIAATLENCRELIPDVPDYPSDFLVRLATEIDDGKSGPVCEQAMSEWIYLMDQIHAAKGEYDKILSKSLKHPSCRTSLPAQDCPNFKP